MKVKCPHCEKSKHGKIITTWKKKIVRTDYRDPRYMPDEDGDSYDLVGYGKSVTIQKYHRVLILNHKRGIFNRHRCLGSGRKIVIKAPRK